MKSIMGIVIAFLILAGISALVHADEGDHSNGDPRQPLVLERPRVIDSKFAIGLALSGGGFRSAAFAHGAILELQRINFCLIREKGTGSTYSVFMKLEKIEGCERIGQIQIGKTSLEVIRNGTLWDNVDMISAVSGGSIAGAFSILDAPPQNFEADVLSKAEEFRDKLLLPTGKNLLLHMVDILPFVPGSLFETSFSKVPRAILFVDMLPLVSGRVLVKEAFASSEEVEEQFEQRVFKNVTMEAVFSDPDKPLLIHGTNLNDGKIFTFSHHDLNCIESSGDWKKWPLARAVAASSAIPGLVSPLKLDNNHSPTQKEGNDRCHDLYGDKVRNPDIRLADGGIYENLAIDGMIRHFSQEKRDLEKKSMQVKDRESLTNTKLFIISVNAETSTAPPGHQQEIEQQLPIALRLNQSFNVLMDSRTDVSRTSVQQLEHFGIFVEEVNFRECLETTSAENPGPSQRCNDAKAELDTYDHLDSIRTHFPNENQASTLVSSGRRFTENSVPRIKRSLQRLVEERSPVSCEEFTDESRDYCWPKEWIEHNVYDGPLADRLKSLGQITRSLISPSTQNLRSTLSRLLEDLKHELYPTRVIRYDALLSSGLLVAERAEMQIVLLAHNASYLGQAGVDAQRLTHELQELSTNLGEILKEPFESVTGQHMVQALLIDRKAVLALRSHELNVASSDERRSQDKQRINEAVGKMEAKLGGCSKFSAISECYVLLKNIHRYLEREMRRRATIDQSVTLLKAAVEHKEAASHIGRELQNRKDMMSRIVSAGDEFSAGHTSSALDKLEEVVREATELEGRVQQNIQKIQASLAPAIEEHIAKAGCADDQCREAVRETITKRTVDKFKRSYTRPRLRAQNNYAFYGALGGFVGIPTVKEYANAVSNEKGCKDEVTWEVSLCEKGEVPRFQYPSYVDTYANWLFVRGTRDLRDFLNGKSDEDLVAKGMAPFPGVPDMAKALGYFWQALDASEKAEDLDKFRRARIASRLAFTTKVVSRANELFSHANKSH